MSNPVELTIVIPCLNEAETLPACIDKARRGLQAAGVAGEVLVADNGSTDGSAAVAEKAGARVVTVGEKGYGSALRGGIEAAQTKWIIVGDADDSYDFLEIPRFVEKLREGYDLVQGCRLPAGGGVIKPGAMPFLHRWWGNPMFSLLARWWFRAPIHDIYCGLRGFRKDFQQSLDQRCAGMEFATEMIIKASLRRAKLAEVPITLHPDGRKSHAPHLKTFRDGWRTLRFFLLCTPRWLFLIPGLVLLAFGGALSAALAVQNITLAGVELNVGTLMMACMTVVVGFQLTAFAFYTKIFAIAEGLLPEDPKLNRLFHFFTLEKGIVVSLLVLAVGLGLLLRSVWQWKLAQFGPMPSMEENLRRLIPAATLILLGVQSVFSCFFLSVLGMKTTKSNR